MIPVRFIWRSTDGKASDTLNQIYNILAVPRIGDTVYFFNDDKTQTRTKVEEVVFSINPAQNTHEIIVYYGNGG